MSSALLAQTGKISGKVISTISGQALPNASVTLIEKSKTIIADQNGSFSFNQLPTGTYSLKCSNVSYNQKIVDEIIIKNNEITSITISLDENKSTNREVIVTSRVRARSETVAALLIAQKNSASVSDGITFESIRKTPDRSAGDVLKRVSGASIQDDRFAIIRGLNDRYNAAFINGSPLPSSESDRKAFAFDIFPSAVLDNLVIYKSATPDKTGDFAGGIIDITTKATPSKNFTSVSVGVGYNSLITGKGRYLSENKGKTDWIGIDDGTRAIPQGILESVAGLTPAQVAERTKLFGNYKWGIKATNTTPNFNFQISKGINVERKQKEFLGALFAINYNKSYSFYEGDRNIFDYDRVVGTEPFQTAKFKDSIYNEEIILGALANISIKLNSKSSISWKNNFSVNTDNKLVKRFGFPDISSDPDIVSRDVVRWFTSNQILSSQLAGEHLVSHFKTKINWLGAYSNVQRELPNYSRTSYSGRLPGGASSANFNATVNQFVGSGSMFFTNSDENIKSIKIEVTQPYTFLKNSQNFLKFGGGYQIRKRDFTSTLLGLLPYNQSGVDFDFSLLSLPEEKIFEEQNLGLLKNGNGGFITANGTLPNSSYSASSATTSFYMMNDQRFFKKFRLIYGARIEKFNQKLNTKTDNNRPLIVNTLITDFLPSVNFVYSLTTKTNVRLSYSQTINRPEFRELAPFLFFDYVTQYTIEGQTTLQRAKIKNYDFRFEIYPGKAQLFSVSAFYKDFTNPIEIITIPDISNQAIYNNATSAKVYGVEAEFRTLVSTLFGIKRDGAFLSKFTLASNVAFMKSSVKLGKLFLFDLSQLITERALQGQSPYLLNGSINFTDEKSGTSATFSGNRVGDRISIAGNNRSADIYEKARTVADFQLSKLFLKKQLEVKITARDILAQDIGFYFDYDQSKTYTDKDKFFSSYKAPTVFIFTATYKF